MFPLFTSILLVLSGCFNKEANQSTPSHENSSRTGANNSRKQQAIKIIINGEYLDAHLNDSSAGKAFARELPIYLTFRNFMDMPEKIADLHHKLPTTGMPRGHAGAAGTIGYWSPDHRIVFYWGTEDYYEGIHIIGKFDSSNYRRVIKSMKANAVVRIEKANQKLR